MMGYFSLDNNFVRNTVTLRVNRSCSEMNKKKTFEAAYENPFHEHTTIASRDDFKDCERDFPQAS